ncbi:MAG: hypothetical protein PUA69_05600, partial [Erysipelotrichaceae bacterium]|nr:hypothetical protein [Erysipelotrichaceae bacterium]
ADAKADAESKNAELTAVNEKVEKLLADLKIANADVDAKKLDADSAKTLYEDKANVLFSNKSEQAKAQAKLDDLVNTLNRRDKLEEEINGLNEAIPEYERDVEDLDSLLADAKANASSMESIYKGAKKTYDTLVAEQKKADEAKAAEEAKNGKAELDVNNNTISYSAAEISVNTDGSLTFRSNADYKKFKEVQVDGKTVDPSQYTASEGSTVIVLHKSFVDTLSKGNHTITIVSEDGSATTSFVLNDKGASVVNNNTAKTNNTSRSSETKAYISATPDTSDVTESAPWVFMVVVSLVTVGGVVYLKHSHE